MATAGSAQQAQVTSAMRRVTRERSGGENFYVAFLGLKSYDTAKLLRRVEQGFPYRAFEQLQRSFDVSPDEMAQLVQIPKRTLARRRESGRLTAEESDRLLRLSRLLGLAVSLFEGDVDAAREWLASPAAALGNRAPRDVAATEIGAREVENLIGRLEHGVFA
jgi:putative toxin-antitoxin system antitoxin component (TIGR02293 family)